MNNVGLSAGPVISTQEEAQSVNDLAQNWKIIARCPHVTRVWNWCFPLVDMTPYQSFYSDGIIATVQRRDESETVLLAKWAR